MFIFPGRSWYLAKSFCNFIKLYVCGRLVSVINYVPQLPSEQGQQKSLCSFVGENNNSWEQQSRHSWLWKWGQYTALLSVRKHDASCIHTVSLLLVFFCTGVEPINKQHCDGFRWTVKGRFQVNSEGTQPHIYMIHSPSTPLLCPSCHIKSFVIRDKST